MTNREDSRVQEIQSVLRFNNYIVNKIEFYTNDDFEDDSVSIKFDVNRNIEYIEGEDSNALLVTLDVKLFDDAKKNNYPFSMNLSLTGFFEIDDVTAEQRTSLAEVNAVAILFPYVRSIITTFTANANVNPLVLPPINIVKLIESQELSN